MYMKKFLKLLNRFKPCPLETSQKHEDEDNYNIELILMERTSLPIFCDDDKYQNRMWLVKRGHVIIKNSMCRDTMHH